MTAERHILKITLSFFRSLAAAAALALPLGAHAQGPQSGSVQVGNASMIPILMPQMLTIATRMGDPALVKFVSGIIRKVSVNAAVAGGDMLANRPDSRPTLAHVRVPVLIVEGADDPLYPVELQKMMRASRPGTKLAIIPGAAHAAIIEKPKICNKAIESFAAGIR